MAARDDDRAVDPDDGSGEGEPTIVHGRTQPPIRRSQVLAIAVAVVAFMVLWIVVGPRDPFFVLYLLFPAGSLFVRWRPRSVIDASGIKRPWRRPSFITWDEVASIDPPTPGVWAVHLRLASGKSVTVDDVAVAQSALVGRIGGKPMTARPVVLGRPPSQRPRTDMEVEADVTRKAQALAEHRKQMAAESARLHWKP